MDSKDLLSFRLRKYGAFLNVFWLVFGAGIVWLDLILGPYIRFPILLIFPVALASWFNGLASGVLFSILLPFLRVTLELSIPSTSPPLYLEVNAGIQILALCGLSVLVNLLFKQFMEIRALRGMMPECVNCHKNPWKVTAPP